MNSLTPLALPRFHVKALASTMKGQRGLIMGVAAEEKFQAEPEPQPEVEAETPAETEEQAAAPDLPMTALQPDIDTGSVLNSLETAIAGLEREAVAHTNHILCEFIQAAFPRLAEDFLAEEVVRELGEMAPPAIERLSIKVPAYLEVAFQTAIKASPRFSEICELQTVDNESELIVDADWREGGLQFDMNRFVSSSLARLAGPEPK
ncbi:MAG: hypothetical protein ABJH52_02860 [Henriciella sp.]